MGYERVEHLLSLWRHIVVVEVGAYLSHFLASRLRKCSVCVLDKHWSFAQVASVSLDCFVAYAVNCLVGYTAPHVVCEGHNSPRCGEEVDVKPVCIAMPGFYPMSEPFGFVNGGGEK